MSKCGHINLFVVVDRFSKMWLLYLVRKLSRPTAKLFFSNVWIHFGPCSIVSYIDSRFLGRFWTTLWENLDTKLKQ
jgi:hypothetical protein